MHGVIEMQAIRKICIGGIIEADLEMYNERKAWYNPSNQETPGRVMRSLDREG